MDRRAVWICLALAGVYAAAQGQARKELVPAVSEWVQISPRAGESPGRPITASVSYDRQMLYADFRVAESAAEQRGSTHKRDNHSNADYVSIGIDPTGSGQQLYVFLVTASGVESDGTYTAQTQAVDYSWDAAWTSVARRDADGYTVQIRIPIASLPGAGAGVRTWGLQWTVYSLSRQETDIAPKASRGAWKSNRLNVVQRVQLELPKPKRAFNVTPYTTGERITRPGLPTVSQERVGADASMALTGSLRLDATVNPDFSEVESDLPQLDANRTQPVYFPEKRPFFTQGATYFQTAANPFLTDSGSVGGIFYSRRIVNPEGGAKISGELGKWQVGAMAVRDRGLPATAYDRATDGVVRLKRPLRGRSALGITGTARDSRSSRNGVIGADADFRLGHGFDWQVGAFGSETDGVNFTARQVQNVGPFSVHPFTTHSKGWFGSTVLFYNSKVNSLNVAYYAVSPNFDPQLGWQPVTNNKDFYVFGSHSWWTPKVGGNALQRLQRGLKLQSVAFETNQEWATTFGQGAANDNHDFELGFFWPSNTSAFFYPAIAHQWWNGRRYDTSNWAWNFNTQLWSWLQPNLAWSWGHAVDLAHDQPASMSDAKITLTHDIQRLTVSTQLETYRLWSQSYVKLIDDLIWSWRGEYQLDHATYARVMLLGATGDHAWQYNFLVRREITPGTEFYVGVGADYLREALPSRLPPGVLTPRNALQSRGLFFKVSRRFELGGRS